MRTYLTSLLAGALALGFSTVAFAATSGQFKDMCAWGLANDKEVHTNCNVHAQYEGKTYCFSSADAKANFMKDPKANLTKAEANYKTLEGKS